MIEKSGVGERIRRLREGRKLSLDDLAKLGQVNRKFIEELEAGELVPSMAPLLKIARALGVCLSTFLDDAPSSAPVVTRAGHRETPVQFSGLGPDAFSTLDFFPLARNKKGRHMEPFIIDVHPTVPEDCTFSFHEGEEFIFVMAGQIEVYYDEDRFLLNAGDSIYYDSTTPHQVQAAGDADARILAVVYADRGEE